MTPTNDTLPTDDTCTRAIAALQYATDRVAERYRASLNRERDLLRLLNLIRWNLETGPICKEKADFLIRKIEAAENGEMSA